MNLKGILAFFLVCVAAGMVVFWMICVFILGKSVDAGMAALLASFVTLFTKMASDAIGYQYNSSAGSDKKDDVQAKVTSTLVAAVPAAINSVVATPWWTLLTDPERFAIEADAPNNSRLTAFITAAKAGKATKDDLAYLVQRGLLTQPRADTIATSD